MYNNTTGSNNTAVGQQAGESNTTGSNNTYIGWGSGYGIQTGSNNGMEQIMCLLVLLHSQVV